MLKSIKSWVVIVVCVTIAIVAFYFRRYNFFQSPEQNKTQPIAASTSPASPAKDHPKNAEAGITKHNATSHVVYSRNYEYPSSDWLMRSSFSQDGILFGTAQLKHDSATLRIWNAHSYSLFRALKIPRLENFAFSPNHTSIAVITGTKERYGYSYPYTVEIYDVRSGKPKHVLVKAGTITAAFYRIIYSRNGRYIAADAGNSKIYIWNAKTGKQVTVFHIHGFATAIAFSPNSKTFAALSGQYGGQAQPRLSSWSIRPNKLLRSIKLDHSLTAVTFSPNGKLLAVNGIGNGSNNWMDIIDINTLKTKHRLRKKDNWVGNYEIAFSPDGNYFAVAKDSFVYIYKLQNMTHAIARFPIPTQFESVGNDSTLLAIHFISPRQLTWAVSSFEDTYKITLWRGAF